MRAFLAVPLLALFPFAASAVAGGQACQVAACAVPTPGLAELVMGSKTDPVPTQARLTHAQIETLANLDTKLRQTLQDIEARTARLPAGARAAAAANADLAHEPLPELVTRFVADAARGQALLLDFDAAPEFRLASTAALDAERREDEAHACALCLAVRRGVEAGFAWKSGELGALSPAQVKEAAEVASARDGVRRTWTAALQAELKPEQLAWLRKEQMRWLESTLRDTVAGGLRSLPAKERGACASAVEAKCGLCSIVLDALGESKSKS